MAHAGQLDKRGDPYIFHPLRVMLDVSPRLRAAAVLHDVIEDTDENAKTLSKLHRIDDFSIDLVVTLSRLKAETYDEYLQRIKAKGPDAIAIKMADLKDNTLPWRMRVKNADKYERAKAFLAGVRS
jgi:(p)ppGpp synthase/HD superfamily hydrolase